jgi:LytS/YehU family sensor histidine kinase
MSGLISSDPVKAQNFFDELSQVYRYVLETIDCKSVRLSRELEFIESYRFLMNIRFTDSVIFHIHNSEDYLDWWLPPLSLQFAVENALKHNSASEITPLIIHIYCSDGAIFVVNNIQYKYSKEYSSGLGQNNINKRYALITKIEPEYFTDGGKYFSKFPLIPTKPIIKNNC